MVPCFTVLCARGRGAGAEGMIGGALSPLTPYPSPPEHRWRTATMPRTGLRKVGLDGSPLAHGAAVGSQQGGELDGVDVEGNHAHAAVGEQEIDSTRMGRPP